MRALVIGYGSIGTRHAQILSDMEADVAVYSKRNIAFEKRFTDLKQALETHQPDYCVIANNTAEHLQTLETLETQTFKGNVLVEKPLFHTPPVTVVTPSFNCYVGYNLRFHALAQQLRAQLKDTPAISAQLYVGQHLKSWRKSEDSAHQSYSSHKNQGGGVLRDLSHEIDMAQFLFGPIVKYHSICGRFSDTITADSDDHASLSLQCKSGTFVTIDLNYIDHTGKREYRIHTEHESLSANYASNQIISSNGNIISCENEQRNDSYRAMHQAVLSGDTENLCSYEEGLAIVKHIAGENSHEW